MKKLLIFCFLFTFSYLNATIVSDFSFDDGIVPTQWTTSPVGMLSIGNDHYIDGTKGVKWVLATNSVLKIWMGGQNTTLTPIIYLPIYSSIENNDTLRFSFYYSTSKTVLLRQTDMILNYKGWREFHRHYWNDFGPNPLGGYLGYIEIAYKPAIGSTRSNLWFDGAHLATAESGTYATRYPGPHFKIDYSKGYFDNVANVVTDFMKPFMTAIPSVNITSAHRSTFSTVMNGFTYSALGGTTTSTAAQIAAAKDTVKAYKIFANSDGSLKGKVIPRDVFSNTTFLQNFSLAILNLANAALATTPDNAAKDSLIKFTRYLLDRGLAEGGITTFPTNNYDFCRKYLWMGWTRALPLYKAYDNANPGSSLTEDVKRWLRWAYQYGTIYRTTVDDVPGDYIYTASRILFQLASFRSITDEQIRDYICGVDFYNKFTNARVGGWDSGIKIDGTYFHHKSMHLSYSYSLAQWIIDMYKMNNTPFTISQSAYNNMAKSVNSELLDCATTSTTTTGNAYYANSLCGRGPFALSSKISASQFSNLIKMGGYLIGQSFEPAMAANYNYYFSQYAPFSITASDLSGFYQYNYGSMGVYRSTQNWVATMKGMTKHLWGTEIYYKENRFGRYQAYGALEVMYRGSDILAASGYPASNLIGYDWNVVPGATVVRHSPNYWYSIQPYLGEDRADEYQKKDFVGSLALNKSGVFAMDFIEDPIGWHAHPRYNVTDNMKFKKSVFVHNNLLVCLGSNITFYPASGRSGDSLATNMFQYIFTGSPTQPLYINNSTPVTTDISRSITLSNQNYWTISPATTGFFVPQQSGSLKIVRGVQSTPPFNVGSSDTETTYSSSMLTSTAAKAWITHSSTLNNNYEFVVIPNTTPSVMLSLSSTLGSGHGVYDILQRDSVAHVVRFNDDNTCGYAIFKIASSLPLPLISADNPCLVMTQSTATTFNISLDSPDLNYQSNINSTWISAPKVISIRINGVWMAPANLPSNINITNDATTTIVAANVQDGLSANVTLTKSGSQIREIENSVDNTNNQNIVCYTTTGKIHILNVKASTEVFIYNVFGQQIISSIANLGLNTFFTKSGIYVVKVGSFCQKVIVK